MYEGDDVVYREATYSEMVAEMERLGEFRYKSLKKGLREMGLHLMLRSSEAGNMFKRMVEEGILEKRGRNYVVRKK